MKAAAAKSSRKGNKMNMPDITTETRTLENLEDVAETLKNTDSNMIREWIESLLPGLLGFALQVVLAAVVYAVGSRVIRLARKILRRWLERTESDTGVRQFLDALLKYVLYFILIVIILTLFGVTAASVVALVGSAGLTLGLALQGSLSNLAGGVLILLLKPFKVGDFVEAGGCSGTVEEISLNHTRLITPDGLTALLPNKELAASKVTNSLKHWWPCSCRRSR